MDTNQEARIERYAGAIAPGVKRMVIHATLVGLACGLLAGIGFGVMIGARFFG